MIIKPVKSYSLVDLHFFFFALTFNLKAESHSYFPSTEELIQTGQAAKTILNIKLLETFENVAEIFQRLYSARPQNCSLFYDLDNNNFLLFTAVPR